MGLAERGLLFMSPTAGGGSGQPVLPGMEGLVPAGTSETKKKGKAKETTKKEKKTGYSPIIPIPESLRKKPYAHRLDIDGFKDEE